MNRGIAINGVIPCEPEIDIPAKPPEKPENKQPRRTALLYMNQHNAVASRYCYGGYSWPTLSEDLW